jgi:hypothetical protein
MAELISEVEIRYLKTNIDLQPRVSGLDVAHVAHLQEVIDDLPPLKAVRRGADLYLIDGWHRLAALQNLGREIALIEVISDPPHGDLRRLAFDLNATHGRPLSLADRRAEAARLLHFDSTTSDREIGRHCGLSQPTVAKIRGELEGSAQIEQSTERVGRGGYRYEVGSAKDVDEAELRSKNFERFARYVAEAVDSSWWDEVAIVQILFDDCAEENYGDILEALRALASPLNSLADVFESSMG